MSKIELVPAPGWAVVLPDTPPEESAGVLLPQERAKGTELDSGQIIAGAPELLALGQRIVYRPYSGLKIEQPDHTFLALVKHSDILAYEVLVEDSDAGQG